MTKYALHGVHGLVNLINTSPGIPHSIHASLSTPAGLTDVQISAVGLDIKNMSIAEIEELAIKTFIEKLKPRN